MNYYSEWDPKAAAWLRELIKAGEIPEGHVDERSIIKVTAGDLAGYIQCHFFAGIGGWCEALRLAGVPSTRPLWTASLPCQPFSAAGKGLGVEDERHLWPIFFDLVKKCGPELIFGEQVARAIGFNWLDGIRSDLETEDYAVGAAVLGAHSVRAPHKRLRLNWLAVPQRNIGVSGTMADTERHGGRADQSLRRSEGRASDGGIGESLALPDGGNSSSEREQRGGEQRFITEDRRAGVAHGNTSREGLHQQRVEPGMEGQAGGDDIRKTTERTSRESGVAVADSLGERGCGGDCGGDCGGGHAENAVASGLNFWDGSQLINCRDGKKRRIAVEPSLFPLAHGVPGRVGLLRGAGNAIVPQASAEFIKAFLEIAKRRTNVTPGLPL